MPGSDPLTSPTEAVGVAGEERPLAEWAVHLARREPRKVWVVVVALAISAVVGALALHHWVGGVLAVMFVFSSAAEFVLPIRYRITDRRVQCSYGLARLEMQWDSVRRVLRSEDGVRLSPFPRPSRLDAFRGIRIRFADGTGNGSADHVQSLIGRCLERKPLGG
jgi:hypothetical protein